MNCDIIDNPHLVNDNEIGPLLRRKSQIECLLKDTIARKKVKLKHDQARTRYEDELASIEHRILTIIIDRSMYQSIARLDRGKKLFRIRTN